MAACSGIFGGFLRRCCGSAAARNVPTYVRMSSLMRLICSSSSLHKKSMAATFHAKYTEEFIKQQIEEFNIGKRHLANMMGEDPETINQEDIDRAIRYLFPSGLFDKKARPIMKHPLEVFPKQRAVQWGEDGRPFSYLFYTGKQSYYSLMHAGERGNEQMYYTIPLMIFQDTYEQFLNIQIYEDQMRVKDLFSLDTKTVNLVGSRWLIKEELEEMLVEQISDHDYMHFLQLLERMLSLPYCSIKEEYVLKFRRKLEDQSKKQIIEPLQFDENGVAFSKGEGQRKTAKATAIVRDHGSGKITVNGVDYLVYFPSLQEREQLMFPFQFLDRLGMHDMECTVYAGGASAQAGAIRLASSRALLSFITEKEVESMRQAGLLTPDPRVRERKKPGQEGARRKFTWKKR
ncbi:28S ribosomal protein S9, mitochondrial isoform X1 [Carcharodon carcharias]|uniref:28S ribosomal protein S9, mitochondrial isoform X1 n=1 Tax=Carcharodon carcharias TaxID=13397 RepID=UPI001B7E94B2|nr:28S ribosomal protein S9, mitochondrial isoform X1 [Carcharodon carcharias]